MEGAKSFLKNVAGMGDTQGQPQDSKEGKHRFGGGGIGNTAHGVAPISASGGNGYLGGWNEDRFTNMAIIARIFQMVCAFSMLITVIILAAFQTKWVGKLSGLTALLLIVTVLTMLVGGFVLALSFFPHSWHLTQDKIIRTFEQPRLALVMNATGLGVWLILAMTQTISAYTMPGCKDPAKDPHAESSKGKKDDFLKALPSFCTTKKAGAAFAWLILLSCVATMMLFLRMWKMTRKNGPRIPPFVHPAEGTFEPLDGEEMEEEQGNVYAGHQGDGGGRGGVPAANRYGEGGDGRYGYSGYDDPRLAHMYGAGGGGYGAQPAGYGSGRSDPFADGNMPRQSYDYGAYNASTTNVHDPYAAIQQQLRAERPPQLPPLYRG